jgi:hypothetical protein
MRANLRRGKLYPEPRSIVHAERRAAQLSHEIESIANARNYNGKPTPTEVALSSEWNLLLDWINEQREAMKKMSAKKKHEGRFTEAKQTQIIINALRTAAERYDADEQTFRQVAEDLRNGKSVPMFTTGDAGVVAAKRLADQFFRQAEETRAVLLKLEEEGGDGTVTE